VQSDNTVEMSICIREAEMTDLDDLQGIFERSSLSNDNDRASLLEHPEWLVLSEVGIRERRMRVAVNQSGSAVGFATYLISDGVAELEDLFVDPPWMRRGVGEALVIAISTEVQKLKFETLEVTANPHAMAFYERLGFVAMSVVDTEFYPAARMRRPSG
jgi:ribosomal protein S18 acetylase RimI-like enzyme